MRESELENFEREYEVFSILTSFHIPSEGWIKCIRNELNMTLAQFGKLLGKSPVTVREFEIREKNQNIQLNKLKEIAELLNCRLIYALVPKESSFEEAINKRDYLPKI